MELKLIKTCKVFRYQGMTYKVNLVKPESKQGKFVAIAARKNGDPRFPRIYVTDVFFSKWLNDDDRNVILAHELGHHVLGHLEKEDSINLEFEADAFAASETSAKAVIRVLTLTITRNVESLHNADSSRRKVLFRSISELAKRIEVLSSSAEQTEKEFCK